MGIKFLCPNGHKLHVKAFLSGKKAICPKCGARVIVPAEHSQAADEGEATPPSDSATPEQITKLAFDDSLVDSAMETMSAADAAAGLEARNTGSAPTIGALDPITEAPAAVWYVRPPTGGQYGPASAEIMRSWLNDGRVGPNSLVWRSPWSEWRSAASTFAQLAPAPTARSSGTSPASESPAGAVTGNGIPPLPTGLPLGHAVQTVAASPPQLVESPSIPPLAQGARKRRRKNDVRLIASAVLGILTLILVIVLVLVFRGQGGSDEPKTEESAPAGEESLI